MTKRETRFVTADDLIFVEVRVAGPLGSVDARFVLDTGAVSTTLIPELADAIGYSARDAVRRTKVHSAIGEEDGYVLHVAEFSALGFTNRGFRFTCSTSDTMSLACLG
jgi:predicted aspartyl protease